MKRLPTLKISHKLTLGFLGLILFPLLLLIIYNFSTYADQSARQLTESGQYVLGTLESNVNEKLDIRVGIHGFCFLSFWNMGPPLARGNP